MGDNARRASSGGGRRFVVPGGVPHMAPVLELGEEQVWCRQVPDYLCARESGDQQTYQEIGRWTYSHPDEVGELVAGLLAYAVTTVSTAYGVHAREVLAHIARQRRDCPPDNAHQLAAEVLEGYHASVELVDLELSADADALEQLIDRVMVSPDMRYGAVAGLADITIAVMRWKWGSAGPMLAALRYGFTGVGDPQASVGGLADPGPALTAAFEAALGLPATTGARLDGSSRSWTTGELFTGMRLVTSFLCYRDAGAVSSLGRVREWLEANPNAGMGFLQGLVGFAQTALLHTRGHASAMALTRELITTADSRPVPAEAAEVPCGEEFAEGYRGAPAILHHLLGGDHPAFNVLISRAQENVSLVWGTAIGLAEISLEVAGATLGSSTQVAHGLHDVMAAFSAGAAAEEDSCPDDGHLSARDRTIRRLTRSLQGPEGLLAGEQVDYEVLPDEWLQVRWTGKHSAIDVWRVLTEQFGDEVEKGDTWHPLMTTVSLGGVRVKLFPRDYITYATGGRT